MENQILTDKNIFSVSYLSNLLKTAIENQFGYVQVKGELSGVKRHTSGHLYFTLKDADAILDGVSWKGSVDKLGFVPSDGLEVICTGKITTYAARSKYQMIVSTMVPSGEGALLKLLEERKKKLALEGLFDGSRKRPIPLLPKRIGIITSPTGAVIRDMIHRLQDRCPRPILLWPVLVQGEGAAEQIAHAIAGMNALSEDLRPDLLIVARGGGSLEDLWAFNEECVVRAVAASTIPLISAVGHETDTTLIDYASDLRAPTPTAAAEHAVPVRRELLMGLSQLSKRSMAGLIRLSEEKTLRLDDRTGRLIISLKGYISNRLMRLQAMVLRSPLQVLSKLASDQSHLSKRLEQSMLFGLEQKTQRLMRAAGLLESYSFQGVLKRGFALVRDGDGQVISSIQNLKTGMGLDLTMQDGQRKVRVEGES